jgi:hypothetical protein
MFEGLLVPLFFMCLNGECVVLADGYVVAPCCCQELKVSGQEPDPAKANKLEIVKDSMIL